jgi:hypothetical protein
MIRFALACGRGHTFEGWFKSNAAFEGQVADDTLECPICADRAVRKAIMAPAVARADRGPVAEVLPPLPVATVPDPQREAFARLMQMMRAVRRHVEDNFEDVGDRFATEARAMHEGTLDPRDIYGQATGEEVRELLDDGVRILPLPPAPKLDG